MLNTLWALIVVHIAGGQAFNMLILRNFIEDIPKDFSKPRKWMVRLICNK